MSTELSVPTTSTLARLGQKLTPAEARELQDLLFERVDDPRYSKPMARFLTELPWGGADADVAERIAAAIMVAEDPAAAAEGTSTESSKDLIGKKVVIYRLAAMESEHAEGLGGYLLLEATVGDSDERRVLTCGATQAVALIARYYATDGLPLTGSFSAIPGTGKKGSPALTFIAEPAF